VDAAGTPSPYARFRAGSKMRRPGRACVKRAFVVNMFYVRFLLYRSLSARVKCQKISDSLIRRARSLDLERSVYDALVKLGAEFSSHKNVAPNEISQGNTTSLLYNFSTMKIHFFFLFILRKKVSCAFKRDKQLVSILLPLFDLLHSLLKGTKTRKLKKRVKMISFY